MKDKKKRKPKEKLKSPFVSGAKFNSFTVIAPVNERKDCAWIFRCDCGTEVRLPKNRVISQNNKSCGTCGLFSHIPICSNGHKLKEWGRTNSGACKGCIKEKSLKREYDITYQDYVKMWEFQKGLCALCGTPISLQPPGTPGWHEGSRIEVDHKHGTKLPIRKTVRGLLCGGRWAGCNRKLGRLDDAVWLRKALNYVENPPAQKVLGEHDVKPIG